VQDVQALVAAVCVTYINAAAAPNGVVAKCAVCADALQPWRA
tara:strand:- start:1371 stop:1496 length:126 start_codon:yes stop_codon:yes gene_type:complete